MGNTHTHIYIYTCQCVHIQHIYIGTSMYDILMHACKHACMYLSIYLSSYVFIYVSLSTPLHKKTAVDLPFHGSDSPLEELSMRPVLQRRKATPFPPWSPGRTTENTLMEGWWKLCGDARIDLLFHQQRLKSIVVPVRHYTSHVYTIFHQFLNPHLCRICHGLCWWPAVFMVGGFFLPLALETGIGSAVHPATPDHNLCNRVCLQHVQYLMTWWFGPGDIGAHC